MRVTLIHNPGAGKRVSRTASRSSSSSRPPGTMRYQSSKDDGWKNALKKPADLVAVAGGDGTVARVARRMAGRGIPVALCLPDGQQHLAQPRTRRAPLRGAGARLAGRTAREARRRPRQGPWGERYFVEGIGTGVFARLLASGSGKRIKKSTTKRPKEKVDSALRRLRARAQRMKPIEIQASLDGKDISGRLLFEAVSIPYVGPNLFLAPDSKPGDGHFDVVLVSENERARLVNYLETWQENRQRLAVLVAPRPASGAGVDGIRDAPRRQAGHRKTTKPSCWARRGANRKMRRVPRRRRGRDSRSVIHELVVDQPIRIGRDRHRTAERPSSVMMTKSTMATKPANAQAKMACSARPAPDTPRIAADSPSRPAAARTTSPVSALHGVQALAPGVDQAVIGRSRRGGSSATRGGLVGEEKRLQAVQYVHAFTREEPLLLGGPSAVDDLVRIAAQHFLHCIARRLRIAAEVAPQSGERRGLARDDAGDLLVATPHAECGQRCDEPVEHQRRLQRSGARKRRLRRGAAAEEGNAARPTRQ